LAGFHKTDGSQETYIIIMSLQRTVAVVDDNSGVRQATQALLNVHRFNTIGFSSAKDFLHRDASTRVDCVLLDIDLGGECGIALRRRLKADGCTLPVIFITGSDSDAVRQEAIEAGCVDYLKKPIHPQQLLAALAKALPAPG
jgi:FixJ family two-component response regulator